MRRFFFVLAVGLVLAAAPAFATILSEDLGTGGSGGARPASMAGGTVVMTQFDRTCQSAIGTYSYVTQFCATPFAGNLSWSQAFDKRTIGGGWATWSGGYSGPCFYSGSIGATHVLFTLPSATSFNAASIYIEPNSFSTFAMSVKTDTGVTLTLPATGYAGARGFGFYTTQGESILSLEVWDTTGQAYGWAFAEWSGRSGGAPPGGSPPGGSVVGGGCDLTPIEAKLDAMEPKLDAMEPKLDSIEAKLDAGTGGGCDACKIVGYLLPLLPGRTSLPMTHPCYVPFRAAQPRTR